MSRPAIIVAHGQPSDPGPQQAAIEAAKAQYTGAYDQVYATYDVTSGAWTVSFSKSAAGAKTDRLVVDAAGKVMAAGK